ncbi:MAG: hypothetical protein ABL983_04955 [Nitrospira sp.]
MHHVLDEHSVIVLGAGATKAFLPAAPLAEDDYNLGHLSDQFRGFPFAYKLLESERHRRSNGTINIEQLLTRLQGRMPYDSSDATAQQFLLLSELMREFIRRITFARKGEFYKEDLAAFARMCVKKCVTCITFNYDDVLDQALWEVEPRVSGNMLYKSEKKYWDPDGGYGFFVRPSEVAVHDRDQYMDTTSMVLLKLHGSINWYPMKGERPPYNLNAIYHDQDWYTPRRNRPSPDQGLVARHFEPDPFIIPPVLDKTALSNEPVLQVVWSLAKDAISRASQVFFVGYSMPVTDMAASFLFNESLEGRSHIIRVVNQSTPENKEQIRSAYRKVFPKLTDDQFEFDGALKWVREVSAIEGDHEA